MEFQPFPKLARLFRECVITEKIDGTNAQILFPDDGGPMWVGSRTRWITPDNDNHGFARWAGEREAVLRASLGPGRHFGEWWGAGIQRRYGLAEKRFSLFNSPRWAGVTLPEGVYTVPILYTGLFGSGAVEDALMTLREQGSLAAPGFMDPEGVVVFHPASGKAFKVTLGGDGHKGTPAP